MTQDPSIQEQSYRYFLQEAQELLQALEQELLSLREDYSINKVYTLMRIAHTLKGAAATVGMDTIKRVTHSLEDIFKALCKPGSSIDPEVEALLFEGYECLRLPLTAALTGGQVNDAEILDRTAAVFAQLQDKLGDCFGQEAALPSSQELGFDLTQSIFELGVAQRLDELAATIASGDAEKIATTLRSQAEVFQGLAESLGLLGFGAIAQTAIAALDAHPEQAVNIAQTALSDFRKAQVAVLNGDRSENIQPSLSLQQLGRPSEVNQTVINISDVDNEADITNITNIDSETDIDTSELQNEASANPLLESIWGWQVVAPDAQNAPQDDLAASLSENSFEQEEQDASEHVIFSSNLPAANPESVNLPLEEVESEEIQEDEEQISPNPTLETEDYARIFHKNPVAAKTTSTSTSETADPALTLHKDQVSASRNVRVNIEHLDHLNYSIGELLTNQNRQSLQNEQLQAAVRVLVSRLQQHQQLVDQLKDYSDRQFNFMAKRQNQDSRFGLTNPRKSETANQEIDSSETIPNSNLADHFDSLELKSYDEYNSVMQSILEDTVQIAEAVDAIDLFAHQSHDTLEKQRRLLTSTRDALMAARMSPLGDIFGRLPLVLQQLEVIHKKLVTVELDGNEVLVDKAVVEKLYDPLLHLVRNAFDHGIEPPSVREQRGKPQQGLIEIGAYHQGRYLVIEVRDDGEGLDFEEICASAVERQFITPEQAHNLTEGELTDLLFAPGFSTSSGVNDLSGRGIGLDVVRSQLQALQGSITVNSQRYRGTTFILQIPLSLTIAKLLLCQASDRIYALFTDAIEQILIPKPEQIRTWEDGKALRLGKGDDERLIPVRQLSTVMNYSWLPNPLVSQRQRSFVPQEQEMPIIIIRAQDQLMGLEVDQLIEEQELVIRPLGSMIAPPSYIYGGSILADGRLTLVLDGAAFMEHVFNLQTDDFSESLRYNYAPKTPYYTNASRDLASPTPSFFASNQEQNQLSAQTRAALPPSPTRDFRAVQEKLVLVVDDSITVRQALTLTLQKAGYLVLQAKDGYEGLEQLRHQKGIELVICDIEMPRMNGFEFLKYRQQDDALANIPVVMLTSRSSDKHRKIAAKFGATDYITKPYLEHKVLSTVKELLEKVT